MNILKNNQCQSIKNKSNINIQCCNTSKKGDFLCGVHIKCKNIILFKNFINSNGNNTVNDNTVNDNIINDTQNNNLINDTINDNINDKKKIFSIEDLFNIILNNDNISIYSIRKSINNSYLNKFINTKQSKPLLINSLKDIISKERLYITHKSYIILIQSYYRRWLIYRKNKCYNDTDILTFTSKYDIPNIYFYIFNDSITKKKYAYDIRTLLQIIDSDYPSCPYTFRTFTDEEKSTIINYKNKLLMNGVNITIEKEKLSIEEETEMKIKDVFYQINMLDNYTNHQWFKNLNINELINLYIIMEDIWNYRSNMDISSKRRIVEDGMVFTIPRQIIKQTKSKLKLQNIILDDFLKLITEGINIDEKKLGAIFILTGLVEVSIEAADALPHLIQL